MVPSLAEDCILCGECARSCPKEVARGRFPCHLLTIILHSLLFPYQCLKPC
ncbi:4Fe-4S binding protein [Desulfocucumis palustris]|uniref:4Fe-4S binding protein n=1 Tax=Desulfocucumis palustris TaxID=1898651 RepID=UPI0035A222C5